LPIAGNNDALITRLSLDKALLTFDQNNYNTPQTVTITAVNDYIARGKGTFSITPSSLSADPNYMGLSVGDLTITLNDDETGMFQKSYHCILLTPMCCVFS
jgi:hypothetical protein